MTEPGRRAFVLAPAFDSPGRKDVSGAFQPEARAFVRDQRLAATVALFDSSRAMVDRRYEAGRLLARQTDLEVIALFCHGWRDGLQCGWRAPQAGALADLLALASTGDSTVIWFACDTGRDADSERADDTNAGPGGEGGFADLVAQAMIARGWRGRLFAHATAGHTTRNPYVRVWSAEERGAWVIDPKSSPWRAWVKALRGELRFRFPFLTRGQILDQLAGA